MRQISTVNIKTVDMISHTCRLSYQLYIPSNRIVKPNNRYTRQSASHDFPFYSAPDKAYALTTTNRIAMRFAVCSAPPFRYPADSSDNSKGGTWSGSQPQAELEVAHCHPPLSYPADSTDNAKSGTVSGDSPPLKSCFPASSQAL